MEIRRYRRLLFGIFTIARQKTATNRMRITLLILQVSFVGLAQLAEFSLEFSDDRGPRVFLFILPSLPFRVVIAVTDNLPSSERLTSKARRFYRRTGERNRSVTAI